eukprot:4406565-Amphidinium_carterae.1
MMPCGAILEFRTQDNRHELVSVCIQVPVTPVSVTLVIVTLMEVTVHYVTLAQVPSQCCGQSASNK